MCGGTMGSFISNPAEVALIRMTADGTLPPGKRRNYKNAFNALGRLTQNMYIGTNLECQITLL